MEVTITKGIMMIPFVRVWSGTTKIREGEVSFTSTPPPGLVTGGVKHLCPPEVLSPFGSYRKALSRLLASHGVRLGGEDVYVLAPRVRAAIEPQISNLRRRFEEDKARLAAGWGETIAAHLEAIGPEWRRIVEPDLPSLEEVMARIVFGVREMTIRVEGGGEDISSEVAGDLLTEIEATSEAVRRASAPPEWKPGRASLQRLRRLVERLERLAFFAPDLDEPATRGRLLFEALDPSMEGGASMILGFLEDLRKIMGAGTYNYVNAP